MFKDERGNRYGRLEVIKENGRNKWGKVLWLCKCDCGTLKSVSGIELRAGRVKSCGCLGAITMKKKKGFINMNSRDRYKYLDYLGRMRRDYGLDEDGIRELMDEAKGMCEICTDTLNSTLHIDHNHETGVIRGLLCNNCNSGLGFFKDSPAIIKNAVSYLELRGDYAKK